MPDEDIHKSTILSEGTPTLPKDSEGNIQPADRDTIITIPKDDTGKHPSVSEGVTGDKNSEGKRPPADMEPITTPGGAHNLVTGSKDQVDKTHSIG